MQGIELLYTYILLQFNILKQSNNILIVNTNPERGVNLHKFRVFAFTFRKSGDI